MELEYTETTEFSLTTSPRLSFSEETSNNSSITRMDTSLPLQQIYHSPSSSSCSDFAFCLSASADPSPADRLFSDGKLLPLHPINNFQSSPSNIVKLPNSIPKQGCLKEVLASSTTEDDTAKSTCKRKQPYRLLWRFGRSQSVNYTRSRPSSFCPFPLLRSKSTSAVATNQLQPNNLILNQRNYYYTRNSSSTRAIYSNSSSISSSNYYTGSPRADKRDGNGIRINPVVNMGIFDYLLCTCGSKGMRGERFRVSCSP